MQIQTTTTKTLSASFVPSQTWRWLDSDNTREQKEKKKKREREKTQQVTKCHFHCSLFSSASSGLSPTPQSAGNSRDTDTVGSPRTGQPGVWFHATQLPGQLTSWCLTVLILPWLTESFLWYWSFNFNKPEKKVLVSRMAAGPPWQRPAHCLFQFKSSLLENSFEKTLHHQTVFQTRPQKSPKLSLIFTILLPVAHLRNFLEIFFSEQTVWSLKWLLIWPWDCGVGGSDPSTRINIEKILLSQLSRRSRTQAPSSGPHQKSQVSVTWDSHTSQVNILSASRDTSIH